MAQQVNCPKNLPRDGLRSRDVLRHRRQLPEPSSLIPPKPENPEDLMKVVRETDVELGLAFDGDGDRLGRRHHFLATADDAGAGDVLSRKSGAIIYDVMPATAVRQLHPRPGRRADDVEDRASAGQGKKLKYETGAPGWRDERPHLLGERWYGFDDAIYRGARLEIVSVSQPEQGVFEDCLNAPSTPELNLKCAEGEHFTPMEQLKAKAEFTTATRIATIDGLRRGTPTVLGWHGRPTPRQSSCLRFEADTLAALAASR